MAAAHCNSLSSFHEEKQEKIGGPFTPTTNPPFIKRRLALFEKLLARQKKQLQEKKKIAITVELPDGAKRDATAFISSPYDVALGISKKLAESVLVAKVSYTDPGVMVDSSIAAADREEEEEESVAADDCCCDSSNATDAVERQWVLWDIMRPLEGNCMLKLLKFDDEDAKHVFWHSSAHILGQALELEFGALLTVGPALSEGFYYDAYMGNLKVTEEMYESLHARATAIVEEQQLFERVVCSREEALELFRENPFKQQLLLRKVGPQAKTTVYRCGQLVDLCRGPHLPHTGKVKAFQIQRHSGAYWLGQQNLDSLQRVYGISFPDQQQLQKLLLQQREAKRRDHRLLGSQQHLFFFDFQHSPGSCFWLPAGAKVYNKLCEFVRAEYRVRGFCEVITPNIFSCDLWQTSGHLQHYKENMFLFSLDNREWGLKPMNCPAHCLIFKQLNLSFRQLPLRLADFGVLHRNEAAGALTGLTRVRRFQQDDAHIFCTADQVKAEVQSALEFLFFVYETLGFTCELLLSTKPAKAIGTAAQWAAAEAALKDALLAVERPFKINKGDGAFYGPKIDVILWDALSRPHQCGTIQLDFQLPLRFDLQYRERDEAEDDAEDDQKSTEKLLKQPMPAQEKGGATAIDGIVETAAAKKKGKKSGEKKLTCNETAKPATTVAETLDNGNVKPELVCEIDGMGSEKEVGGSWVVVGLAEGREDCDKREEDAAAAADSVASSSTRQRQSQQPLQAKDSRQLKDLEEDEEENFKELPLKTGRARPVIIHRAILGSIERMCAVLIEHTAGKLPFWLSPRQCIVLPVTDKVFDYAQEVRDTLHAFGYEVELDSSSSTLNKKVREGQLGQWNFLLVVGEKEKKDRTITVRERDNSSAQQVLSLEDFLRKLSTLKPPCSKPKLTLETWKKRQSASSK